MAKAKGKSGGRTTSHRTGVNTSNKSGGSSPVRAVARTVTAIKGSSYVITASGKAVSPAAVSSRNIVRSVSGSFNHPAFASAVGVTGAALKALVTPSINRSTATAPTATAFQPVGFSTIPQTTIPSTITTNYTPANPIDTSIQQRLALNPIEGLDLSGLQGQIDNALAQRDSLIAQREQALRQTEANLTQTQAEAKAALEAQKTEAQKILDENTRKFEDELKVRESTNKNLASQAAKGFKIEQAAPIAIISGLAIILLVATRKKGKIKHG